MPVLSLYEEMKLKELKKLAECGKSFRAVAWGAGEQVKVLVWDDEQKKLYHNVQKRVWSRIDPQSLTLGEIGNVLHTVEHPDKMKEIDGPDLAHVRTEVEISTLYGTQNLLELCKVMHFLESSIPRAGYRHAELLHTQPAVGRLLSSEGGIHPEHQELLKLDMIRGLDVLLKKTVAEYEGPTV